MAINAGISITTFDGFQHFDAESKTWKGITSFITYPEGQSIDNDVPAEGTVVIEESGRVWRVVSTEVVQRETNQVRLELAAYSGPTDAGTSPNFGRTQRGGILNPVNGYLGPYWNDLMVAPAVGRIANMLNMENMSDVWKGDVDLGGA